MYILIKEVLKTSPSLESKIWGFKHRYLYNLCIQENSASSVTGASLWSLGSLLSRPFSVWSSWKHMVGGVLEEWWGRGTAFTDRHAICTAAISSKIYPVNLVSKGFISETANHAYRWNSLEIYFYLALPDLPTGPHWSQTVSSGYWLLLQNAQQGQIFSNLTISDEF